jgi:putative membrane protein
MNVSRLYLTAGLVTILSLGTGCHARAADAPAQDFVTKASIANEFEIESSRLALEKSQDREIKGFAQEMIDDHTKAGDKLKDALKASASHPQAATKLDEATQQKMTRLESLSTDDFNNTYVSMQLDAHKEAVGLFGNYASNGDDKDLKNFASETLPTLKDHLEHVQKLKADHHS